MARTGDNARIPKLGQYGGAATFAADLTQLADDVASLIDPIMATVAALPLTGNWMGRRFYVTAAAAVYRWDGAWKVMGSIERVINGRTGTPPAGAQLIHEFKYVQGLTNASGTMAITLAVPFPNGAAHIFFSANSGTGAAPVLNAASLTKTGFTVAFPSSPTTNVDFSYHAIGW